MASFNKVLLMGRLTKNPGLHNTSSGHVLAEVTLLLETNRLKNGKWSTWTDYVPVTLWNVAAQRFCQSAKAEDLVLIQGHLSSSSWEDKTGNQRRKTTVTAESFEIVGEDQKTEHGDLSKDALDSPAENCAPTQQAKGKTKQKFDKPPAFGEDDLPF